MPHPLTDLPVRTVVREGPAHPAEPADHRVRADVCVVGAGIAGLSAAVESAKLGRDVVLVDSLPVLGGQMVNSLIGLFCGVFGNAPQHRRLTYGLFEDIFADLGASGDLFYRVGHTTTVGYDEVRLGRWVEDTVRAHGIKVLTGASLAGVDREGDRVVGARFATRYGPVDVRAHGFVDASGDAALCLGGRAALPPARPGDLRQPAARRREPRRVGAARPRGPLRPRRREGRRVRPAPPRRARVLLPRPGHRRAEHDPHRGAPRPVRRRRGPAGGQGPGRPRRRVPAGRVPRGLRQGRRALLRAARASPDPLGAGRPPAHRRRGPGGGPLPGRRRPHGLADRAARHPGRLRVGDLRGRPPALRAAALDGAARCREPARRRALRRTATRPRCRACA